MVLACITTETSSTLRGGVIRRLVVVDCAALPRERVARLRGVCARGLRG